MRKIKEEQVIFGLAPAMPGDVPTATLLMPKAGWHYMRDGLCHDFDLRPFGIPLKIVLGRCINHDDGLRILRQAFGDHPVRDLRHLDIGIPGLARKPDGE